MSTSLVFRMFCCLPHPCLYFWSFVCQGSATVECIFFNMSRIKELHLNPAAFKKMYNLRVLEIYNSSSLDNKCSKLYLPEGLQSLPDTLGYLHWEGYPLKHFPSNFSPQNLVNIQMAHSQVEQLWSKGQVYILILVLVKNLV